MYQIHQSAHGVLQKIRKTTRQEKIEVRNSENVREK